MKPEVHRKPTPEEMKQHEKQHPQTLKAICEVHRKVSSFVRRKYMDNPQVMHVDRG